MSSRSSVIRLESRATFPLIGPFQLNNGKLKSITHNFFSAGLGLLAVAQFDYYFPFSLVLVIWLVFSTNFAIDALGHSGMGGRARRTWTTHSVFTAPIWGAAIGIITIVVAGNLLHSSPGLGLPFFSAGLGVLASYSHLLLDALTEGGVYLGRSRIAIAHFSNNNFLLNSVFILLGVLLGITGVTLSSPVSL